MPCKECIALDRGVITEEEWRQQEIYGISLLDHTSRENLVYTSCEHCYIKDKRIKSTKVLKIKRRL